MSAIQKQPESPAHWALRRCVALDVGKWIAAFGVIMIHLQPSASPAGEAISWGFWNFAVPFFFVISLYFFVDRAEALQGGLRAIQWRRILLPYFFWSAVYVSLRLVKHHGAVPSGNGPFNQFSFSGVLLFGEGSMHLHFLPELIAYQVAGCALISIREMLGAVLRVESRLGLTAFVALLGYLGFACLSGHLSEGLLHRAASLLPIGLIYLLFAFVLCAFRSIHATVWWELSMTVLFVGSQWSLFTATPQSPLISAVCGGSLAGLLLGISISRESKWGRWCVGTSFGVYLIHPFWMEAMESAFAVLGYPLQPYSVATEWLAATSIMVICMLSVAILRAIPFGGALALGELRRNVRSPIGNHGIRAPETISSLTIHQ